jgi:acetylornithine deacetylase
MTPEETLLKELMSIFSYSGNELQIGEYIFNLLFQNGFQPEKLPVSKGRFNIVVKYGKPNIYLSAHMDVVKPMLDYRETKTHIYGRGACDTKASVAAMLTAAINAKNEGLTDFGLIFTVGEEEDLIGAKTVVDSGLDIPFVIVGEPTSLEIVNGHFGIIIIKVTAHGKAAHSSRPEKGINAIDMLLSVVKKIKTIPIFPETLISLVQINGGTADNIIPDEANAVFSFRISPKDTTNYVEKFKLLADKNINVDATLQIDAVYCDVPKELSFIETRRTVKYLTELSFFKNGVVIGPGDIQYAHGPDEQLPREELSKAVKIYQQILKNFSDK